MKYSSNILNSSGRPPEPEELKKILEGVFEKFGGVSIDTSPPSDTDQAPVDPDLEDEELNLDFSYLPRDIKVHLDRYVIKQDDAKKALAIAVCDHYNAVRYDKESRSAQVISPVDYHKQNVLITGPTGVGKTYLVKHIAELIGVPFVKADATKFSETGYVGRDVDDLVRDLVKKADGNVSLAEYGIIYIDEIDKLAGKASSGSRDVSGRGVQTTLLKLMEETEVSLANPMDMQSQMMQMMKGDGNQKETISTKHILFIVSGAFSGLDKIIEQRQKQGSMGFGFIHSLEKDSAISEVDTEDFIEYGFEAEFIGRLPVRVHCQPLEKRDLANILTYSEGSVLRQYERQFQSYGVKVDFSEDAIELIAELAEKQKTGARALITVLEKLLRDFKYEMPGTGASELRVTRSLLENRKEEVLKYAKLGQIADKDNVLREVSIFTESFEEENGIKLKFSDDALLALIKMREETGQGALQLCKKLYKDYPYGLQLISSKAKINEIELTEKAVDNADRFLSDLVLSIYGNESKSEND